MKLFFKLTSVLAFAVLAIISDVQAQCSATFTVASTPAPVNVSCNGFNDGHISATVTAGVGPFRYTLLFDGPSGFVILGVVNTPSTSLTFQTGNSTLTEAGAETFGIPAGDYQVRIRDFGVTGGITCDSRVLFVSITQPLPLGITINDVVPDCDASAVGIGQIDLTVTGGTAPYNIIWTGTTSIPNGTQVTAANLDADIYNISITDARGCTFDQDIAVPVTTQANAGPLTGLVCSPTTGSFVLSGNAPGVGEVGEWSGPAGVTFSPDEFAPNATANNLNVGVNTLTWTITDIGGVCTGSSDFIDVTYSNIDLTKTADVVLDCFGAADGTGTFTVTGGISNFNYTLISNTAGATITMPPVGTTTFVSFTNAGVGVVTVQVQDASGCTSQETITITQPPAVTFGTTQANVTCFGASTGTITVTAAGGTGPYEFSNDNGANFTPGVNPFTFTGLAAGGYNIIVRDANLCTSTATLVTITQPAAVLSFGTTQTNVTCFGASTGTITVTAAGGVGPYQFSSDNGANFTPGTNPFTFTGRAAGGYNIIVRDANLCTTTATLVTITQPAATVTLSTTQSNVTCFGASTGTITVTAAGGVGPYQFSSDNGANFTAGANPFTFTGRAAGGYNIVVRDANLCTSTATLVTITQPAAAVTFGSSKTNVTCFGASTGTITVTAAGGVGPYQFSNDNGANFTPGANPFTFTGLAAGGYNIIVRDANSCTTTATLVTITQPAAVLSLGTTQNNVTCFGASTGTITVTAAGGTGPYQFSNDNGANFAPGTNPFTFTGLAAGGYNIIVRDANLCTTTATLVTITQPAATVTFGTTQSNVTCFGASTGTITITAAGGVGPYQFSSNNGANFTAGANPFTFTGLPAGGYNILVRDANSCTTTATLVTITQPAAAVTFGTTQNNVTCSGTSTGTITITAAGGVGPYEFSNDNGANFTAAANPFTFTGLAAGGYNIVVRDASLCTTTASLVTITQPAAVTFGTTQANVSCFGVSSGTITVTAAGGTGPYQFSNDNGANFTAGANPFTFTGLAAGGYNIIVRDVNLCASTATLVTITQPAAALTFGTTQTNVTCFGTSTGTITITAAGGVGPYEFSNDNGASFLAGANPFTFTGLPVGGYNIIVRDVNTCTSTATLVTITEPASVLTFSTTQANVTCFGASTGTITVTVAGGTGPYEFSNDNGTNFSAGVSPFTFTGLAAAGYNIVVRDANLCTTTATLVTITQPVAGVTFGTTQSNVTCFGASTGTITVTAAGGAGPYEFSSNNGVNFTAGANPFTFTGLAEGGYNIVVRDANLCTSTATLVTITQPAVGVSFGTTQTNVICFGASTGTITVTAAGGAGPYEFSSDNGANFTAGANPFTFTGLAAGGYNIVVRDANLCATTATLVTITQPAAGVVVTSTSKTDATCVGVDNGSIQVNSVTGGTPGYQYSIDNGGTFQASNTFPNLAAATYDVVARDAGNCVSVSVQVIVGSGLSFAPSTSFTNATCSGIDDGTIQVTSVSGGSAPHTYSIDNGSNFQASNSFTGLAAGSYDVVAKDNNGCLSTVQAVTIGNGLTFNPQATPTNASCLGVDNGSIQVTGTTGGVGPFEYSKDGGTTFQTSDTFTALAAADYDIIVRDANTCLSTTLVVTVGSGLSFDPLATPTAASCSGVNNGSLQVTGTTGGTGPFEYSNNGGTSFQTSDTFTGLVAGDYDVVVRDASTCLSSTLVVTVGSGLSFDPLATPTAASCSGVNNGSIQVTGTTGGVGPFEYSNNGGTSFQTSDTFTGLASGSYDIVVRDANLCISSTLPIAVGSGLTITASVNKTDASCLGNDGSITINSATGGTAPYEYSINNGVSFQVSNVFSSVSSGNYNVVVRDANLCLSTAVPIAINTPSGCGGLNCFAFTVTSVEQRPSCALQDDGSITFTVTGGTPNYIVTLADIGGFNVSLPGPGPNFSFTDLSPANYAYKIEDAAGNVCVLPYSLPLQTNVIAVATGFVNAACFGEATGQATITVQSGGASPYFYSLDNGGSWISFTSPHTITTLSPNPLPYSILVADDPSDQCPAEVSVTIGNSNPKIKGTFAVTNTSCNGSDGAIDITSTTGGAGGPYTFAVDGVAAPEPFANLSGGGHVISMTDNTGCSRDTTITVTFPGFVSYAAPATTIDATCTTKGVIGIFIPNPPGSYEIGFTTDPINQPTNYNAGFYNPATGLVIINKLEAGTYYVWIRTSSAACPTRFENSPGVYEVVIGGPQPISFEVGCRDRDGVLALNNISASSSDPVFYEIFGNGFQKSGEITPNAMASDTIHGFATGDYVIWLRQDQSTFGCTVYSDTLTAPAGALDTLSIIKNVSFPDQPTGSIQIKLLGSGAEPYEAWLVETAFNSDTLTAVRNPVIFEVNFNSLAAATYTLYLEDADGCRKHYDVVLPFDDSIFVPNIFTPNNDGINENFYVRNLPLSGSKLSITNRWGKEVFSSGNYNPENLWDGGGSPDGVYYYRLQISGGATYTGWVEIVRGVKP